MLVMSFQVDAYVLPVRHGSSTVVFYIQNRVKSAHRTEVGVSVVKLDVFFYLSAAT